MIRYSPFLKAKRGELTAMGELAPEVKQVICPMFDFPRKEEDYDSETFAKDAKSIANSLRKHWGSDVEFYFDDFDIGKTVSVDGEHQYAYILKCLKGLQVVPVVALDRIEHNHDVVLLKREGVISSSAVAFRVEAEDFEDFEIIEDQIDYDLAPVFNEFEEIDLILDCRFCAGKNALEFGQRIASFARKFCSAYNMVRRIIVSGSSIPASSGDVLKPKTTCVLPRHELAIIENARAFSSVDLVAGDYTTVSPFYSDVELAPEIMQNIMTARLVYTYRGHHYFTRGATIGSEDGYAQYFDLAKGLCAQSFFRGASYSLGERYFHSKSLRVGKNGTPGAVIKPSVVAHITYMVLDGEV